MCGFCGRESLLNIDAKESIGRGTLHRLPNSDIYFIDNVSLAKPTSTPAVSDLGTSLEVDLNCSKLDNCKSSSFLFYAEDEKHQISKISNTFEERSESPNPGKKSKFRS